MRYPVPAYPGVFCSGALCASVWCVRRDYFADGRPQLDAHEARKRPTKGSCDEHGLPDLHDSGSTNRPLGQLQL